MIRSPARATSVASSPSGGRYIPGKMYLLIQGATAFSCVWEISWNTPVPPGRSERATAAM